MLEQVGTRLPGEVILSFGHPKNLDFRQRANPESASAIPAFKPSKSLKILSMIGGAFLPHSRISPFPLTGPEKKTSPLMILTLYR
jgi:hypothetical protein